MPTVAGLEVTAIADLSPDRARAACRGGRFRLGRRAHRRHGLLSTMAPPSRPATDVDVRDRRRPATRGLGIAHAEAAIAHGKHVVMVNVEADVLAGPGLARKAASAGTCYSMAYGDQPALVAEMVDWARAAGFHVTAAGKGTKYLPAYHAVTPDRRLDTLRAFRRGGPRPPA